MHCNINFALRAFEILNLPSDKYINSRGSVSPGVMNELTNKLSRMMHSRYIGLYWSRIIISEPPRSRFNVN